MSTSFIQFGLNNFYFSNTRPMSQPPQIPQQKKREPLLPVSTGLEQKNKISDIAASSMHTGSKPIPIPLRKETKNDQEEDQVASVPEKSPRYLQPQLFEFDEDLEEEMKRSSVSTISTTTPINISTSPSGTNSKNESSSS